MYILHALILALSNIGCDRVFTISDLGNHVSFFLTTEGQHLLHTF